MFPVDPSAIGAGAYGAYQSLQSQRYRRPSGGPSGDPGAGRAILGGLVLLAIIAGVIIYFVT